MATFLDRLKGLLTKNNQNTHIDFNKAIYNYLGDTLVWNPENDDTYINEGYRANATIYAIVNLINKAAGTIPLCVYEIKSENELKKYKAITSSGYDASLIHKTNIHRKNALIELDDTELHQLLARPNPSQSYNSWLSEIIAFGKLTGNRYIYGIKPETGANQNRYRELYVLPSQNVEIQSGGIMQPVKEYTLSYNGTYRMPADCVCHIKDVNLYYDGTGSHLYGMSPLKAGLRSMDSNNEALSTGKKYLQNQMARGILMSEEGDLNEVQAMQLKDKFRESYQGSKNAGDVIITPKKLSWVNFGLPASDLSLIEQYNGTIKDLCNIYNVPVQLLNNTDSSTYNNMKEAKKALYQNAVIPELNKIKDELNRWLTPQYGEKLYIDFDYSVIPELQEETEKVVAQMTQAWWLTPNEKRAAMNYGQDEDTPEMNDYYVPANLMPINNQPEEDLASVGLEPSEKRAKISQAVENGLKDKVKDHNDKHGDDPGKRATYGMLAESFRRGVGAYRTNPQSVRPSVTSEEQWAYARVNGLLYALRTGKFKNKPYDTDLLPQAHPLSSKKSMFKEAIPDSFSNYPESASNNAKRMIEYRDKYGRDKVSGGTIVGWRRAQQLANREAISFDTIKRVFSFLSRHKENAKVNPKYKDEPWRDNGYVAYNLWGGASMLTWSERIVEKYK